MTRVLFWRCLFWSHGVMYRLEEFWWSWSVHCGRAWGVQKKCLRADVPSKAQSYGPHLVLEMPPYCAKGHKQPHTRYFFFFYLLLAAWLPGSYYFLGVWICCWCCTPIPVHWYSFCWPWNDVGLRWRTESTPPGVNSMVRCSNSGPKHAEPAILTTKLTSGLPQVLCCYKRWGREEL